MATVCNTTKTWKHPLQVWEKTRIIRQKSLIRKSCPEPEEKV